MPKLKKVIAGLALSAAIGGGALAAGATAASASTAPTCWGCSNEFDNGFNNTFDNSRVQNGAFQNGCSHGCSQNTCSDLDDILWDVCVAGNCSDVLPLMFGCGFN